MRSVAGGFLVAGVVEAVCLLLGGCLPNLGATPSDAGPGPDSAVATDALVIEAGPPDSGPPSDGGTPLGACDNSPPSQEVDRYVWGENFTFYFTPAGAEITKLYVPANSLVHFSLAGSTAEEVHIFKIGISGCETPDIGLGTEGNEATYDWKAPLLPATYVLGGLCVNHPGMEFDVIVTP